MSEGERFWLGAQTMHSCPECKQATTTDREIPHDEACPLHTETDHP